jgi:hypothetical protein
MIINETVWTDLCDLVGFKERFLLLLLIIIIINSEGLDVVPAP